MLIFTIQYENSDKGLRATIIRLPDPVKSDLWEIMEITITCCIIFIPYISQNTKIIISIKEEHNQNKFRAISELEYKIN